MNFTPIILSGGLVGVLVGFFGSGGSILTVPALVYLLGLDAKSAVATSLLVVGLTSVVGILKKLRLKAICPKAGLFFGGAGIVSSYLGSQVAWILDEQIQLAVFALLLLFASLALFTKSIWGPRLIRERPDCQISKTVTLTAGALIGFLTGLLGVGGGFLIVPTLLMAGLSMRMVPGTSLVVVTLNCASGFAGYWGRVDLDWGLILVFTVVAGLSSLGGVSLAQKIPPARMEKGFALFLFVVAVFLVVQNREVFL